MTLTAGLYFGQVYPGGNGLIPAVLPPPPPPKPQVVRLLRELPPTRQVITVSTPRGYCYRWATDEPIGENVPSGVRNSSTAPGGFEQFDAVLPRNPNVTYNDLEPMSTIRAEGIDGSLIGEYRLEAAPDTSGNQMSISPSAVGWQTALNDADAQSLLIIDRDLSHWGTQDSQQRQADLRNGATTWPPSSGQSYAVAGGFDPATGVLATLSASFDQPTQTAPSTAAAPWSLWESVYDSGSGTVIGKVKFQLQDLRRVRGGLGAQRAAVEHHLAAPRRHLVGADRSRGERRIQPGGRRSQHRPRLAPRRVPALLPGRADTTGQPADDLAST